jgi:hypothetical protein
MFLKWRWRRGRRWRSRRSRRPPCFDLSTEKGGTSEHRIPRQTERGREGEPAVIPQIAQSTSGLFHYRRIDDTLITSETHTHPSHSETSRLLTSSLSLGVPVPRTTQCTNFSSLIHLSFLSLSLTPPRVCQTFTSSNFTPSTLTIPTPLFIRSP